MAWQDDIEELEAEDRAALRFWETPEEQACGNVRPDEEEA